MVAKTSISDSALRYYVGEIVAENVSFAEFMDKYAADFCEWVAGVVTKKPIVTYHHNDLNFYLRSLMEVYLELRPIGQTLSQPFVMHLCTYPPVCREPDTMLILGSNPHTLHNTFMDGPADIVLEVVSEGSVVIDYGQKFCEYEQGGVPEYWIVDGLRKESRFYRLDATGRYQRQSEDENGNYMTPALPGLQIHVPTLWQPNLPGPGATSKMVSEMPEGK